MKLSKMAFLAYVAPLGLGQIEKINEMSGIIAMARLFGQDVPPRLTGVMNFYEAEVRESRGEDQPFFGWLVTHEGAQAAWDEFFKALGSVAHIHVETDREGVRALHFRIADSRFTLPGDFENPDYSHPTLDAVYEAFEAYAPQEAVNDIKDTLRGGLEDAWNVYQSPEMTEAVGFDVAKRPYIETLWAEINA